MTTKANAFKRKLNECYKEDGWPSSASYNYGEGDYVGDILDGMFSDNAIERTHTSYMYVACHHIENIKLLELMFDDDSRCCIIIELQMYAWIMRPAYAEDIAGITKSLEDMMDRVRNITIPYLNALEKKL